MKKVLCDICGQEIKLEERLTAEKGSEIQKAIGSEMDICPACRMVGSALDPEKILLEAWKEQIRTKAG